MTATDPAEATFRSDIRVEAVPALSCGDDRAIDPWRRQRQLLRRLLPRPDGADRCRAGQTLVLGRAEVDRRPRQHPQVHRPVDREVVRPIRDVAEDEDDDNEPEGGLERRPTPAVSIE